MASFLEKILRTGDKRVLRQLEAYTKAVNSLEDSFASMTDEELRAETDKFRERVKACSCERPRSASCGHEAPLRQGLFPCFHTLRSGRGVGERVHLGSLHLPSCHPSLAKPGHYAC